MNISLPETPKRFIDEQVSTEGYSSVSEYIRALVRDDQKRKARERVEALLLEGLESGEATEMTKQDWVEFRREAVERLKAQRTSR